MILLFNNSKGGVAKTTSVAVIAQILAVSGYKTLVVDLDPQNNAGKLLGVLDRPLPIKKNEEGFSIEISYRSMLTDEMDLEELKGMIQNTEFKNLDLIQAEEHLKDVIYPLHDAEKEDPKAILTLKKNLDKLSEKYKYIIIDSAPFESLIIDSAICAADRVYVPVEADNLSYEGLISITNNIERLNEQFGLDTQFGGLFITKAEGRTSRFQGVHQGYQERLGDQYIPTPIRKYDAIGKSATVFMPLLVLDKRCPAIEDYTKLCIHQGLIDSRHYQKFIKYIEGGKK